MQIASSSVVVVLALALAAASSPSGASQLGRGAREPGPLRGVAPRGETGLHLLVAAKPPLVVDVDSGRVTSLQGVRSPRRGPLRIVGVGGRSAVVVAQARWRRADLYGVRGSTPRIAALGTGSDVAPAAGGSSVWVKSVRSNRCALRQVTLDGRLIGARRVFPCAATIQTAGSVGLVVNRTRVIDPRTGRTRLRTRWGVLAAAGQKLVLAGPDDTFVVHDAATNTQRRLAWPHTVGRLDEPAVDPRGRFVAVAFANPAWRGGAEQALDVWLIDTTTMRLTEVPSMPIFVSLKFTSMTWTSDGRLILLAQADGRDAVAIWTPGEAQLVVKTLRLPARGNSGSDSFAVLR
ncbi:MAG: hypothetical protein HOQ28_21125 [Thermoleophilia bacterium]|nr:hypothetical protein [Thermoleophilia bacterium]